MPSSRPVANDRRRTRAGLQVDRERREPPEQPEPDRERLPVPPPGVAAELGHHRQRERGVADEDDEQHPRPVHRPDELEPDDEHEPDHRRPAAEALRVLRRVPAADPERAGGSRADVVERRERVEPVPDRVEERRDDRDSDPAVDPQEERLDVAGALSADDPLGDDPGPADQPDRAQPVAEPRGRHLARTGRGHRLRADVREHHERERQRDRQRRPGNVDRERQPRLVRDVERVRGDGGRCGKRSGYEPARDGPGEAGARGRPADHGVLPDPERRRVSQ